MQKILHRLSQIGLEKADDELMINRKRFVVYEAFLMSLGGVLWGIICLLIDKQEQSITPFGYVILSIVNIYTFKRVKNFSFTQGFQTGISLLLPFIFQWHLGGFYASGGVMLWSLLSLAASLSYTNFRTSLYWLGMYVLLVIFSGWFDQYFQGLFPSSYDIQFSVGLVTMNIAVVSILIFLLVIFYVVENTRSLQEVKKTQAMLLQSERMAALGQLSAGIAHEINTPFGAIKAISQESMELSRELLNSFYIVCHNLDGNEADQLIKFIVNYSPKESFMSTSEERGIRKSLEAELAQLSIDNARGLSERLVQIGIHSIPQDLQSIFKKIPSEVVDVLYRILLVQKNNASILSAVEKASRIVMALKMYVHASSEEKMKYFDLRKSIETVITIYGNQLKRGIQVQFIVPENIEIYGFEDQIAQVWTNVVVNACQAMQFKGKLTIDSEIKIDKVIVRIIDSGDGIDPKLGDKIFEPFFSTKQIGEGSGLGLDIVKKIVERHGGRIYYQSELSVGTSFFVELPMKNVE